jgi:hypothetical protein
LQEAQQFDLREQRHRIHFIEKKRPLLCFVDQPIARAGGSSESSSIVTEQFILE